MRRSKVMVRLICVVWVIISLLSGCKAAVYDDIKMTHDAIYADDIQIADDQDKVFYTMSNKSSSGETNYSNRFGSFSGKDTVWTIQSESGGTLNLSYDVSVQQGECKLVLVDPEGEVQILQEGEGVGEANLTVSQGESRLMTVGKSAKGAVTMDISDLDGCTAEKKTGF